MSDDSSFAETSDFDAVEIAHRIKVGDMARSTAVVAALANAKRLGLGLGCIATLDRDFAMELVADDTRSGPFVGVPTLIKDTDNWVGLPTRMGSRAFPNVPATAQTPYMDAIAASGIIPIGKSAVPEFAMHVTTEPVGFGACVNPWNKAHSAGGSSGGAAVAVATGIVPIAHAGDAAGSIRIPAACCGVLGYKPSRGGTITNGDDGGPAQVTSQGAIARSVRDLVAWMSVTQARGADAPFNSLDLEIGTPPKRLRIGIQTKGINGQVACPETQSAVMVIAKALTNAGHLVRQEPIQPLLGAEFRDAFALYWGFAAVNVVAILSEQLGRPPTENELELRTLQIAADFTPRMGALPAAVGTLMSTWDRISPSYNGVDVILSPVTSRPAPVLGTLDIIAPGMDMVVHILDYASFTPVQNASGQPAISIPVSFDSNGIPIGVQLAAKPGEDALLLALAHELELFGAFQIAKLGS